MNDPHDGTNAFLAANDDAVVTTPVESALAAAFPDRAVDTYEDAGISWNEDNRALHVRFETGGPAYLKVAVDGDGSRAAREAVVIRHLAAHTDVMVPDILDSDPTGDPPYLATADVGGTPGYRAWQDASDDERVELTHALGRTLARVHACRFEEHGHVTAVDSEGDTDGLPIDPAPWTDVLVDTIEDTRSQADGGRFDHHFDDVLALVDANRDRLNDAPAALLHGDPAQPNAFVHEPAGPDEIEVDAGVGAAEANDFGGRAGGEVVALGLLDFEIAHVGDPVRELQRAKRQFVRSMYDPGTDRHVEAFYDGYRACAGRLPRGFDDRYRLYDAVSYLIVSGFFETWAPDFEVPTGELAVEVRDEMARRLDAAHACR